MKTDYNLISFLLRGKRRNKVLTALTATPKTPKAISQELEISTSNVSNALSDLEGEGLVKCITPESHFQRFYEITPKGREALKQLESQKLVP